jgi:hypothetical protein
MSAGRRMITLAAVAAAALAPSLAAAQETGIKAGLSVSRLHGSAAEFWDGDITATTFGGHVRLRFGPLVLQPEIQVATKGASDAMLLDIFGRQPSAQREQEQLRLEYIEVPVLLVLPVRVGAAELFALAGPALMLESRCRWVVREQGLRSTFSCEPAPAPQVFARTAFDYGVVAGGGASYPIGSGRLQLEARHSRGMRNIHKGNGELDAFNRTFSVLLGYSMAWEPARN